VGDIPVNDIHPFESIEMQDMAALAARYPRLVQRSVSLSMESPNISFFDEIRSGRAKGRRGEVVLVIRHSDGQVWLHRKRSYPPDAYRLLSGGIGASEMAVDAASRECFEETSMPAAIVDCLGIVRYALQRRGERQSFVSYFFVMDGDGRMPTPLDEGEEIVGFRRVPPAELPDIARRLRQLPTDWQDWGNFRAIGHEFVAEIWRERAS
jgi:8-oxo-dGTP pyrophosphatase MutT (NUDIX family)